MSENWFASPADLCRGTDFWMLNDRLEEGEIRRQLREMRAQGVASVIARTYIGLKSGYPGADFLKNMRAAVDEAKKQNMTLFMQAGYMPEAVPGLPPDYSLGNVRQFPAGTGEGTLLCAHGGYDYRLAPSGLILDMLSKDACAYYVKKSYEEMWQEFRPEFGKTIVSMWVDEPSYFRADLPWTDGLPAAYREMWGEAFPMDQIYLLFVDAEGCGKIRLRFWRTVLRLIQDAYFASVRDFCHANGLWFSGHLMREDRMESQIRATCFTMPLYKYFDVPGIDYLTAQMNWRHGEIRKAVPYETGWSEFGEFVTPLQCASAAHQNGSELILAEMYGVSTENLNLRDQKRMFDHFAALGINHRSVHGLFYSLAGRGKRAYPPHVNDYQPYWPMYHHLTDALARETAFLRRGRPVRDVLVLHPMETAFTLHRARGVTDENQALARLDQSFCQLLRGLCAGQVNFELGDEETLATAGGVSTDGALAVGKMAYRTVVLPGMRIIRESTLALLRKFLDAGGRVIVLDGAPELTDGGADAAEGLRGARNADGLRGLMDILKEIPAGFRFEGEGDATRVLVNCRRDGEDMLFFLTNDDCAAPVRGRLAVPGSWRAEVFHPEDGSISPAGGRFDGESTRVDAEMPEGGSALLRLRPGAPNPPAERSVLCETSLEGGWRLKRHMPNALVLEFFRFACAEEPLREKTYPILAIQHMLTQREYRGKLTLEARVQTEIPLTGAKLLMEEPEAQRLFLDGAEIGSASDGFFAARSFRTVPLPDLAPGTHTLRIERRFDPLTKARHAITSLFENLPGVELEPMAILGDFAVRSVREMCVPGCIRMSPDFVLTKEDGMASGEIVGCGYPFYWGAMSLTRTVHGTGDEEWLALEGVLGGAAEVYLNGIYQGALCWAPYRVRLSGIKRGENELEIRVYGTLRNLVGPWHRPVGEIGACWAGYEFPNMPWEGSFAHEDGKAYPDWYEDRVPDRPGWTESYLLLPMGVVRPVLRRG